MIVWGEVVGAKYSGNISDLVKLSQNHLSLVQKGLITKIKLEVMFFFWLGTLQL